MLNIDRHVGKASYLQVIDGITQLIASGALEADEKLPSVRSLALDLSINPNTIQKAYTQLDASGVTYSVTGVGSFVAPDAVERIRAQGRAQLDALAATLRELALTQVDEEAVHEVVRQVWKSARENEQSQTPQKGDGSR